MPDQGQTVPETGLRVATPQERDSVSAYNRLHDINIALEIHFGYEKERSVPGSGATKRQSTPADNKRLLDLCLLIRAFPGRSIQELFDQFETQTHEDRNTFDKLVDILIESRFDLEYVERYSLNPSDRRTKSLRLTGGGAAAVNLMRQIERTSVLRQLDRGDFAEEDARPGELESQAADYAELTMTDDELLSVVRGEHVDNGK